MITEGRYTGGKKKYWYDIDENGCIKVMVFSKLNNVFQCVAMSTLMRSVALEPKGAVK